jgi:zinc transport system ATP-binding protein
MSSVKNQPAVAVENLSYSYDGLPAVDRVTFSIDQGEFLGVIGPNGGGKTTLLRLLLGLLRPDSGRVRIDGSPPEKKRYCMGYIPQETGHNKMFPVSVRDVVLMGLAGRRGFGRGFTQEDYRKADLQIEQLGLLPLANRPIGRLSGGQRQKVLLARALVGEPAMLFLDEPTASIDTTGEDEIYNYLSRLNEGGVTIVLVTHNVGVLSRYVKSVACINRELYFHPDGHIDQETVNKTFGCPVDIIAHGIPHRVFHEHSAGEGHG